MRPLHLALFGLIGLAALCLATMWLWTIPIIQAGSGGMAMMDFMPADTPSDVVYRYLTEMTQAARDTYLGPQRILDTVFPLALAAALSLAIILVLRPKIGRLALVAALVPLVYLYVDLLENAAVAGLLRTVDPLLEAIEMALLYTEMKFLLVLMAGLILALGLFSNLVGWSLTRIGQSK